MLYEAHVPNAQSPSCLTLIPLIGSQQKRSGDVAPGHGSTAITHRPRKAVRVPDPRVACHRERKHAVPREKYDPSRDV
jgi:hypothetical protein